jgi:AraC-like DNA-binding protein
VADAIRLIEASPETAPSLDLLARRAAARLIDERTAIIDIAFDSGFGDVSNFNHAFREESGMAPRRFRQKG